MGTVPIGTGELRRIHSRVVWMSRPVERSITVSAPHRVAHRSLSNSSSIDDATEELPMLTLTFTRNPRPITIGSDATRRHLPALDLLDVAACQHPRPAQRWQALARIAARPAGVVEPDGLVRWLERHLGEGHPHVGPVPLDVDLPTGDGGLCHVAP